MNRETRVSATGTPDNQASRRTRLRVSRVNYRFLSSFGEADAVQVADRFHLIHNLAEVLEQVLRSQMSELRRITSTNAAAGAPETNQANGSEVKPI